MQDAVEMLRDYREQERPRLERLAAGVGCVNKISDKIHLYLFIVFMLVTTTIYMAWNIHHVNKLRQDVQQIVGEKGEMERKAGYFIESYNKQVKR